VAINRKAPKRPGLAHDPTMPDRCLVRLDEIHVHQESDVPVDELQGENLKQSPHFGLPEKNWQPCTEGCYRFCQ